MKYVFLLCSKGLIQVLYSFFWVVPVRKKVVLLSRQQNSPPTDFLLLQKTIKNRYPDYQVIIICRKLTRNLSGILSYLPCFFRQLYHLATAEACAVDGYLPAIGMVKHRKHLIIVQMWHALGALKKFGHQTIGNPMGHTPQIARVMGMHRHYTFALCPGKKTIPIFAHAFDIPSEKLVLLAEPHVDVLHSDKQGALERVYGRYPQLREDKNIKVLYAPTFRKGKLPDARKLFSLLLESGHTVIFAKHPHDSVDEYNPTRHASNFINNQKCSNLDLLHVVDYLITDYSAIAFEAALLEVPILFYVPDIVQYRKAPGLNIDPMVDFPAESFKRPEPLVEVLLSQSSRNNEVTHTLRHDYLTGVRDDCTSAVVDLLVRGVKPEE